jgi:cellulose biosynthesis protein BcsQ
MRKIAFHLQKGGVGKTTLSTSVAYALSREHKTILIDCDPQGNSSSWLLDKREPAHELADVLYGRVEPGQAIVQIRERLFVLPTFSLDGELKLFGENQLSREPFVFVDLCEALEAAGFKAAVFDLSPGMSQLERSVLLAVDEIVIPMMPDVFSLDGLETFGNEIAKIEKGFKRKIHYRRLVINAHNESIRQFREILDVARGTRRYEIFTVGQDQVFRKAQAEHLPAQEMSGKDKMKPEVKAEIDRLASAILEG